CSPEFAEIMSCCAGNSATAMSPTGWRTSYSALHCNEGKNNFGIHRPAESCGRSKHCQGKLLPDEALNVGGFGTGDNPVFENSPCIVDMGFDHQRFVELQLLATRKPDHRQIRCP